MSWTPVFLPPDVITVTQRVDAEAVGLGRILLVPAPKGYAHFLDGTRIEWGDLWFRPCDGTWVEVGSALVGRPRLNPSLVCVRRTDKSVNFRLSFLKEKFDKQYAQCDTSPVTKLYNIGAYGIPGNLLWQVQNWELNLRWSAHARAEAVSLVTNLDISPATFGFRGFIPTQGWEIVELEATDGKVTKVVARRPIRDTKWSLVLVIQADGTVKTCWANLTSDTHRTLDQSKYAKI